MQMKTMILGAMAALFPVIAAADILDVPENRWQVRARAIQVMPDESSVISPIGGKVHAGNALVPEVDVTYYFTKHIAAELIAATTNHSVSARGTAIGDVDLGDVWLLPPTLTVQYHFLPDEDFQPYVGAGINYTMFYNADKGGATSVKYSNSFGTALQAGFDYKLADGWYANLDVKKLFLSTDVKINGGGVRADVDLDPWIVGVGVGYRF
jgi:outer membrane protein